jgi:hypothetical protein
VKRRFRQIIARYVEAVCIRAIRRIFDDALRAVEGSPATGEERDRLDDAVSRDVTLGGGAR